MLERSDQTALTSLVTQALFKARANAERPTRPQYDGIPALAATPRLTTAIFGLGGHDVQPRHIIAAFKHMADGSTAPADLPGLAVLRQGRLRRDGRDPGRGCARPTPRPS